MLLLYLIRPATSTVASCGRVPSKQEDFRRTAEFERRPSLEREDRNMQRLLVPSFDVSLKLEED